MGIGLVELFLFASAMIALFVAPDILADDVNMHIDPRPTYCQVNLYCNISAINTVSIDNTSDVARTYHVVHAIYANDRRPGKLEFNVPVNPHSKWSEPRTVNLMKRYENRGNYIVNYFTTVTAPGLSRQIQVDKYVEVNS